MKPPRVLTRQTLGHSLLAAAFVGGSIPFIVGLLDEAGGDGRLYRAGAETWLSGGDPWLAGDSISRFAGPPTSVLVFTPAAWVDPQAFGWIVVVLSAIAGLLAVRRFGLPLYWFFFPPLTAGIWTGNPSVLMIGLASLAVGAGGGRWKAIPAAIGLLVKPLVAPGLLAERRFSVLALAALMAAATVVLFPGLWLHYAQQFSTIAGTLTENTHRSSAWYQAPWLLPPAIVALIALALIDLRAAAWLLIPALGPVIEYHWAVLLLPVAHPVLAAAAFVPDWMWPAVVIAYVGVRYAERRRHRAGSKNVAPSTTSPEAVLSSAR